jgi:hypothetical protein
MKSTEERGKKGRTSKGKDVKRKKQEKVRQEVMERTNPPTFFTLFNKLSGLQGLTLHKITHFCTE